MNILKSVQNGNSKQIDDKLRFISNLKLESKKNINKLHTITALIEFQEYKHLILCDMGNRCLHIIDSLNFNYIKKFELKTHQLYNPSSACELINQKSFCFVDFAVNDIYLYLVDQNYCVKNRIVLTRSKFKNQKNRIAAIDYNETNNLLYLVDNSTCSIVIIDANLTARFEKYVGILSNPEFIKISNNKVYICDNADCSQVIVLDADLNFKTSIGVGLLGKASSIMIDKQNSDVLYVTDIDKKCIHVFDLNDTKEPIKKISLSVLPIRCMISMDQKVIMSNGHEELNSYTILFN